MTLPVVDELPTPPQRGTMTDAEFAAAADAWVMAIDTYTAQLNALVFSLVTANSAANFTSTSATSLAIGTGSKAFTTDTGKLYQTGQWLIAASAADPTNFMIGYINSYNANNGALTITVTKIGGSGTKTDWIIALSGTPGLNPGQWAQQAAITTTGGASITFTSISNAFSELNILINGISGTGTAAFRIELSADGVTFTTPTSLLATTTAATTYRGSIRIIDYLADTGMIDAALNSLTSPAIGANLVTSPMPWAVTGGISAIRLSWATGTFDVTNAILRAR